MNEMGKPDYLDSHLHLQDRRFAGDREAVLRRAQEAGVTRMFCNATREEDWQQVLALAARFPAVVPFLGIHPWFADTVGSGWEKRLELLLTRFPCGIGEAGLDRKCRVDLQRQQEVFRIQLQLAAESQRPLSIHCLGCWGRLVDLLEQQKSRAPLPAVMIHAFSGSLEMMQRLVRLGCWISFSTALGDPGREPLQRVAQQTPIDRILLETDAPDQLPAAMKTAAQGSGACNEPANIPALYRFAANLHYIDLQDFCRQVWQNGTLYTDSTLPR
jgi:TatD DNase family protein